MYSKFMTEFISSTKREKAPSEMSLRELALAVTVLKETLPEQIELIEATVAKLNQMQRLSELLGKLAPGGTAPRTALEQIWKQSETDSDESPILLELREMLSQHWGDWKPALRDAEGLPPAESSD